MSHNLFLTTRLKFDFFTSTFSEKCSAVVRNLNALLLKKPKLKKMIGIKKIQFKIEHF